MSFTSLSSDMGSVGYHLKNVSVWHVDQTTHDSLAPGIDLSRKESLLQSYIGVRTSIKLNTETVLTGSSRSALEQNLISSCASPSTWRNEENA